jgi:predicted MFS family arabinose efflux permease
VDPGLALAAVFGASALALAIGAAAPSYLVLLIALVPAGAAAAGANPATNRVLAELPGRRGALTGLKQSGVHLGALAAGGVVPLLTVWLGWRGAFAALAALCIAGIALVAWLPERGVASTNDAQPPDADAPRSAAAHERPPIARLATYSFCSGAGLSTVMTFLPLYGEERLGLGDTAAGMLLAAMAAWGLVSSVVWGSFAERRARATGGGGSPLPLLATGAVGAALLIAAAPELGGWSVWVAAVLLGLTAVAANAVVMLTVVSTAPPGAAGEASGRVLTAFFVGLCVAGPVFGTVVDLAGYLAGWLITTGVFAAGALVSLPLLRVRRV